MKPKTVRQRAEDFLATVVFTRADLVARGMSWRQIADAVERGRLTRLRRDRYVLADVDADVAEAVRIGGRLSCLSLLTAIGVFVHRCGGLHVHVVPGTSRIRKPRSEQTKLHWRAGFSDVAPLHATPLIEALGLAIRCQTPRAALATLDSALHHELLTWDQMITIFDLLPERFAPLLALVDAWRNPGPRPSCG